MAKTIQQEWEGFWAMVKPENASPIQMREMKKAFFSGALVAYVQMDEAAKTQTPGAESEAAEHMQRCYEEAMEFHKTMIREYAEGN